MRVCNCKVCDEGGDNDQVDDDGGMVSHRLECERLEEWRRGCSLGDVFEGELSSLFSSLSGSVS